MKIIFHSIKHNEQKIGSTVIFKKVTGEMTRSEKITEGRRYCHNLFERVKMHLSLLSKSEIYFEGVMYKIIHD